ncbi:MAG: ABC transporter ATP-binding protein [Cognatishimia sp.]|uniref:ABC transporter ATP-binding protein n=1 Tax=Cognatishimia sp. TaxID=2211648 RepID=UPI003B8C7569
MKDLKMSQEPILRVENLVTSFKTRHGDFRAVDDVSIELFPGETLCLVGESGSGKSVLSRSVLQIVDKPGRIAEGQILFKQGASSSDVSADDAVDIARLKADSTIMRGIRGKHISMIFQEPMSSLSPVHRIGNQIDEMIRLHNNVSKAEARKRTVELLREVEIRNPEVAANQFPFEFSGGMRQRAMIAMALACNPEILIADEPTTALDVTIQAEILQLLKKLQKDHNTAILFITHDMGVVAEIADRVAVMQHGKIVEQNDVFALFDAPQHPYTQSLLSAAKRFDRPSEKRLKLRQNRPLGEPVLEVKNLCKTFTMRSGGLFKKTFNHVHAVDNANFALLDGENIGVVGESGSGKTTLARCIQRIHNFQSGSLNMRDDKGNMVDISQFSDDQLLPYWRNIRMIFQDPFASLNPRMTVEQLIGEPLLLQGMTSLKERRARIHELLEQVGLPANAAQRYPHAFSGGQRQRISIARAIAPQPKVVIADEATSALDLSIRSKVMDLLLDIQQELDLSFLFISHDIGLVRYFCDRCLVMYHGKVVEFGGSEQVCTDPQHPYTQALLSAVPVPDPHQRSDREILRYVPAE